MLIGFPCWYLLAAYSFNKVSFSQKGTSINWYVPKHAYIKCTYNIHTHIHIDKCHISDRSGHRPLQKNNLQHLSAKPAKATSRHKQPLSKVSKVSSLKACFLSDHWGGESLSGALAAASGGFGREAGVSCSHIGAGQSLDGCQFLDWFGSWY